MIKLIKLELKGFGCFKNKTVFEYEEGINLIKAQNGKGKTTQIEAIEILLLSNYDGAFADYMNRECNEFEISLEFMLDKFHLLETLTCKKGKTYTTTRNLKNLDTNEDVANGEGVKSWLDERLPQATSKYALFVRQSSDMDIIKCSDSERRDLFKKIQDLDFSKEIKTFIEPKIETVKTQIIDVDKEIFALENKKYDSKEYLDVPFTEEEYTVKKSKLDKLIAEKSLIEEKKNQLEDLKKRKSIIENEIDKIKNSIYSKNETLSKYNSFDFDSEKENIESEYKNLKIKSHDKIEKLNKQIDDLTIEFKDKISEIENEIYDLEKQGENIVKDMESIKLVKLVKFDESSLIKARNDLSELKTKSSISWRNADTLSTGICPICGSTNCSEKYEELKNEAESYDKQIAECEGLVDDLLQKKKDIEEKIEKNNLLKEEKNNLSNCLIKVQSSMESKKQSQKSLNSSYLSSKENLVNQIESENRILQSFDSEMNSKIISLKEKADMYSSQIENINNEISDLNSQLDSKVEELENVSSKIGTFDISSFDESEINYLSNEIKSYDDTVSQNKVIEDYNNNLAKVKKEDEKELSKFKEKRIKFEKEKYNLESAKGIMTKDYPNYIIENGIENVKNDINEFINNVYYKSLNVNFDSSRSGIKMTFGKDIPIKRCSGAEKSLCNIAFVSSFNKNMSLNCILFDEIDASLSDSMKSELYNSVLNMKDLFGQMIIVTHSEKMTNYLLANDSDINVIEL